MGYRFHWWRRLELNLPSEVIRDTVDKFAIKTRAKKGRMAGGAVSFKIETLIQLVEGWNTRFVSPVALSNFAKKELEGYPEKCLST